MFVVPQRRALFRHLDASTSKSGPKPSVLSLFTSKCTWCILVPQRRELFRHLDVSIIKSRKPAGRVGWSWICEWNEKGGVGGRGWREDPKTRYSLRWSLCRRTSSPGDVPLGNQVTVGYRFPPGRRFWGFMWEHLGCCRWPFSYPTWHSPCWMLPVICFLFCGLWSRFWLDSTTDLGCEVHGCGGLDRGGKGAGERRMRCVGCGEDFNSFETCMVQGKWFLFGHVKAIGPWSTFGRSNFQSHVTVSKCLLSACGGNQACLSACRYTPHVGCFLSFVFYFAASGHVSG